MKTEYLWQADTIGVNIPNLQTLIKNGTLAQGSYSVFPAVTYPSHTSMMTGVYPSDHGIYQNSAFDPLDRSGAGPNWFFRDIQVTTLWEVLANHSFITAGSVWPVTCGSPFVDYLVPDVSPSSLLDAKFLYSTLKGPFQDVLPNPQALFKMNDTYARDLALSFLENGADFLALHFLDLDGSQHQSGVYSRNAIRALESIDALLGTVMDYVEGQNATFVIVSDHGFENVSKSIDIGSIMSDVGLLDPVSDDVYWRTWYYLEGGTCAIYVNDAMNDTTMANVTQGLQALVKYLASSPSFGIKTVWAGKDVSSLNGYKGAYMVLEAASGFSFQDTNTGEIIVPSPVAGDHGYNPKSDQMHASFLVSGPGIQRGHRIGMVSVIDVAPTIAHMFGLHMPNTTVGKVIQDIFDV